MADVLGGVGDVLKTALVALSQVTPEGRAIVAADRERRARMDAMRFQAIEKNPALLQLKDHADFYDSVLGPGASKIRKQEFERGQAMEAMFGQAFAQQAGGQPLPAAESLDPFMEMRQTMPLVPGGRPYSAVAAPVPAASAPPTTATTTTPAAPASNAPRAVRNNNPGNIKASATTTTFPGVAGVDPSPASDGGKFLQFETPEDGFAAMGMLLRTGGYQGLSVDRALRRWSNNGYGGELAKNIGIDPNRKMSELTAPEIGHLTQAMAFAEGYRPASDVEQAAPTLPHPTLPPLNRGGLPAGASMSMSAGKLRATISGLSPEQRKQQQYDTDLQAVLPAYLDAFNGDTQAAEEAAIAQIAAERGPNALPPNAYEVYSQGRRVNEARQKAEVSAQAKAQFTPTEQQDAALRLFNTAKYGGLTNGQKAQVDAFLMGRKSAETLNARAADVAARTQYPLTPQEEALSLPVGTPTPTVGPDGTTVPAPTTRAEARAQQAQAEAQAKQGITKPPTAEQQLRMEQALTLSQTVGELGQLFQQGGNQLTGPVASRFGRLRDLLGNNTAAQTQFLQTNQLAENLYVYLTTGKQINETEVDRIRRTMTDTNLAPSAWLARYHGLVRFAHRSLSNQAQVMQKARVEGWEQIQEAASALQRQVPEAFTVKPSARDKLVAMGDVDPPKPGPMDVGDGVTFEPE